MQSTMDSQVVAATELESRHGSHVAAVEVHTEHYLNEEYSVRVRSDTLHFSFVHKLEELLSLGCVPRTMGFNICIDVFQLGACGTRLTSCSHSGMDEW